MCLSADWADIPYSLILLCIVLCCVFGSVSLGRACSCLPWMSCFGWPLPLRFSCGFFSWCCGALLFRCCCSVFLVWLPSHFLFALVAWVLAVWPALSWFPLLPLVVFWYFLVQSVFCWSSLRISDCICNGPVVIPLAWRVVADWLLSSLRFMATKASALCGLCPLTPCCGCCSCAPRSGTEVFALG